MVMSPASEKSPLRFYPQTVMLGGLCLQEGYAAQETDDCNGSPIRL